MTFFLLPHTNTLIHNYSEPTLGFLSAFDAVAAIKAWGGSDEAAARRVSSKAFASLKTLCAKTASQVLHRDFTKYLGVALSHILIF